MGAMSDPCSRMDVFRHMSSLESVVDGPSDFVQWKKSVVLSWTGIGLLLALLGSLTLEGEASAATTPTCTLRGGPWLEGRVRGHQGATAKAVDARIGESVEVFVMLPGTLNRRPVLFSEDGRPGHVSWSASGCPALAVAWRRIEPRMKHVHTKAPNGDVRVYANAVVFGPHHGKWLGYDRMEYVEHAIVPRPDSADGEADGVGALRLVVTDARPTESVAPRPADHQDLGTMRLAASIRLGQEAPLSTPRLDDVPNGIISDRVFRYSFRKGDGFLGWLTAFYNVPYLFGSAGEGVHNQTERFVGADCADILVGALRRAGKPTLRYTNVSGVIDALGRVAGPTLVDQCAGSAPALSQCEHASIPPLRMGHQVLPGDILAVEYMGADNLPRAWDHIVVLVEDRGPNGVPDGILGPHDIVADSGDESGLKFAPLNDQGTVRVVAARPKGVPIL